MKFSSYLSGRVNYSLAVFILLFVFLMYTVASPARGKRIGETVIGRVIIIAILLLLARINVMWGIIGLLIVIGLVNREMRSFVIEGLEDATNSTQDVVLTPEQQATIDSLAKKHQDARAKREEKIKNLEAEAAAADGTVDKETVKTTLQAKSSNELPIPSTTNSGDSVAPMSSDSEPFSNKYSYL